MSRDLLYLNKICPSKDENEEISPSDFTRESVLGTGSYGKVLLVKMEKSGEYLAMKVVRKRKMIEKKRVHQTINEKNILQDLNHQFCLSLRHSFQDKRNIYLLTDFCPGGELFYHICKVGRFNEKAVCFYAIQIVLALDYLHSKDIVYKE